MLIEELTNAPVYDIDRLDKARKGLARKSNDFYITNGRLELLSKLMRTDPRSGKITDLINDLPWHAKTYVMTKVVKILPNGEANKNYKPIIEAKARSEDEQLQAVTRDSNLIRRFKNPSQRLQLAAVSKDGHAIQYLRDPNLEVQLAAVKQNGVAIRHIAAPSLPVQIEAVKQNGFAIHYIKNLDQSVLADDGAKFSLIKTMLLHIKEGPFDLAKQVLETLHKHNCQWPELAVIEQGLKDIPRDEDPFHRHLNAIVNQLDQF